MIKPFLKVCLLTMLFVSITAYTADTKPNKNNKVPLSITIPTSTHIVIPFNPDEAEETAARDLQSHLEKMTGKKNIIVDDMTFSEVSPKGNAIFIGRCKQLKKLGVKVKDLAPEEFIIRSVDKNSLVIVGGSGRGTIYGVYDLLEKKLGCRWFTPDTTVVPQKEKISLANLNIRKKPFFEFREPWMYSGFVWSWWWKNNFDQAYIARTRNSGNMINSHVHPIGKKYGGPYKIYRFGHNFFRLIEPAKYAKTNPEYFALHEGKRILKGDVELCLSNPAVAKIVAQKLGTWMRNHPEQDMFFIGQSDSREYCKCAKCKEIYKKHSLYPTDPLTGGLSGMNISFVNKIATILEKEFPNKRIGMYAYAHSRTPPKDDMKAHKNIVIWYCPVERCMCHPINRGLVNKVFFKHADEIKRYRKIASTLYVYDYVFKWALFPPLDLQMMQENIKTFKDLGVDGIMVDAIHEINIGFGWLRYWLWSQLLYDPSFNVKKGISEFTKAYYGAAAPEIKEIIRLSSDPKNYQRYTSREAECLFSNRPVELEKLKTDCRLDRRKPTVKFLNKLYTLFEKALKKTAKSPKAHEHVKLARLFLQFNMFQILPATDQRLKKEIKPFFTLTKKYGLRGFHDDFPKRSDFRKMIEKKLNIKIRD